MEGILMRRSEVAKTIGVGKHVLRKMIDAGVLNPFRLHREGRLYFQRSEVMSIINRKDKA